ncbi:MAG TPA: hypothetical protein GX707_21140 [Epulopiscium sp.]|nr:hypothetical protein [Candidatus Epulonipiscium sp.]
MKDVTFGVKVPEDLRDEINEIMKESGLVGREFMQQLVDTYMLDNTKQEIPEMAQEIKELQLLTHRINEMYVYLGTRFQNSISSTKKEKEEMNKEVAQEKKNYDEEIEKYKSKVERVKEEVLRLQEEISNVKKENNKLNEKIEEINSYNENYKELNNQYKTTIEQLTKEVGNLKHFKVENDTLTAENSKLQENNDNLASELWFSKREIEKLGEKLLKGKEDYQSYVSRLKEQHTLEKQTAQLELQLEHQKNIELLNTKAANMQTEYNDKLKELLFNIENKRVKGEKNEHPNDPTD